MRLPSLLARPADAAGGLAMLTARAARAAVTPPFEWRAWVQQMERVGFKVDTSTNPPKPDACAAA